MLPVGIVLFSLGYAVAYWGVAVLAWVHSPDHPHGQPPSLPFVLGATSAPSSRPFAAPINIEAATNPFEPFGAAAAAPAGGAATAAAAAPAGAPQGTVTA